MSRVSKVALVSATVVVGLIVAGIWWSWQTAVQPREKNKQVQAVEHKLSVMAEAPDWSMLDVYQNAMTRSDFQDQLETVFAAGDGWRDWIRIADRFASVRTAGEHTYELGFGNVSRDVSAARFWQRACEFPLPPVGRPLQGWHVAIDPGHIGGAWAQLEERWLVVGGAEPICEGDMTLAVAKLLKPRLESLGARVSLVRETAEPVTDLRPADVFEEALQQETDPAKAQKLAEKWFYRTAEIRARAKRVNEEIQPDLVLCLHFNADAWGHPEHPKLVEQSHMHMLVHGGYGDDELALEDQRFAMLEKLLSHTHREEVGVAREIAKGFDEATHLPSFSYPEGHPYVCRVGGEPCLWARNLLANRLFRCPVVFLEPYVMNSKPDFPRMQAGDYPGLKMVNGKRQVSIFREYAEVVCAGVVRYVDQERGHSDPH